MTWLWLFAHLSLAETGDDYGDWGLETAKKLRISRNSRRILEIQWEISIYPERMRA
jgi:hypothetical protein